LRGSAGFAPASLSSPSGEDARSEGNGKEQKQLDESKGAVEGSQIGQTCDFVGDPPALSALQATKSLYR